MTLASTWDRHSRELLESAKANLDALAAFNSETETQLDRQQASFSTFAESVRDKALDPAERKAAIETAEMYRARLDELWATRQPESLRLVESCDADFRALRALDQRLAAIARRRSQTHNRQRLDVGLARAARISSPPGTILARIAEFCCSARTCNRVLNPVISDMQQEYFEALAAGRNHKANMVRIRGYASFATALVLKTGVARFVRGVKSLVSIATLGDD